MGNERMHDDLRLAFDPRWLEPLLDGSHVLIVPIHPQDAQAEREFTAGVTTRSTGDAIDNTQRYHRITKARSNR